MVAYLKRIPAGIAGSVTRANSGQTIAPALIDATNPPTAYGQFVKLTGQSIRALASGDLGSVIAGLIVRPYPFQSTTNSFGPAAPPANTVGDLLRRGYVSALLRSGTGTAARGGQVYVRTTANGGGIVGDIEAQADAVATSAAKSGGNTGNGTMSAVTVTAPVKPGVYKLRLTAATIFDVIDPDGFQLQAGATGVAYADDLGFTLTAGGTPFVAGDGFDITVVARAVAVPDCFFTGPADANGITEIAFNI